MMLMTVAIIRVEVADVDALHRHGQGQELGGEQ